MRFEGFNAGRAFSPSTQSGYAVTAASKGTGVPLKLSNRSRAKGPKATPYGVVHFEDTSEAVPALQRATVSLTPPLAPLDLPGFSAMAPDAARLNGIAICGVTAPCWPPSEGRASWRTLVVGFVGAVLFAAADADIEGREGCR